jgi:hypothetical protein
MEFKDTREYLYLSALSDTFDTLIFMIKSECFTQDQLDMLIPQLNRINDILNKEIE